MNTLKMTGFSQDLAEGKREAERDNYGRTGGKAPEMGNLNGPEEN